MLERHHLAIIHAVDKHGTLTEAANALHLTQSALSHGIKKLEVHLGAPVWRKDGRRLRLTQAGQGLLNLANRVLPQFEHSEQVIQQIAQGLRGALRIGMECHPCYQWLLKVVSPFLQQFPDVDVDVRQAFQFGGLGALLGYDIDMLITPDPLFQKGLEYLPVFEYEHVLVVPRSHFVAEKAFVQPQDLRHDVLITYPVESSRLDVFSQFLTPAGASVKRHRTIETTEIMLQMVSAGRGVAALPKWLVEQHQKDLAIVPVRLGKRGIFKNIHLGFRAGETRPEYQNAFIEMAKQTDHLM
ncbi:LysR family transcriptional regulator [Paraglaciecola chathamensis]|uniref:HTH-type transcriptional regulator MetR n=1 Tax=Paraglaciecola chathamensis S18K6 TaxID=1127672 RepID=A0AAV3UVF4_9ALTE|nr:LysR family transcriptional regulator [Paraglaciecola chathamensis]GAC09057.1 LysR family transcriptional regulator, regulator for metE and metH [Paraglaciecola chathamensis S18K6]